MRLYICINSPSGCRQDRPEGVEKRQKDKKEQHIVIVHKNYTVMSVIFGHSFRLLFSNTYDIMRNAVVNDL